MMGFSADNIAFGMGGALLQKVDRDTQKFAMKCSAIMVSEGGESSEWVDVFKDPITDKGKRSKSGLLDESRMLCVFLDGIERNPQTFDEIRKRSETYL
jgi:nicotinic acid phosphoribosyltransferase